MNSVSIWLPLLALAFAVPLYLLSQRYGLRLPVIVSYVAHCVVALGLYMTSGLISPDAEYYDAQAQAIRGAGGEVRISAGKEAWPHFLSWIYSIFGHSPEIGLLVNVVLVALLPILAALIVRSFSGPEKTAAWVVVILPQSYLWGTLLLRESIAWFLLLLTAFVLLKLYERKNSIRWLALLIATLVLFLLFRGTIGLIIAAASVVVLWVVHRKFWQGLIVASAVGALIAFVPAIRGIVSFFDTEKIETSVTSLSTNSNSGFDSAPIAPDAGVVGWVLDKSVAGLRVLFGPFPWEWNALNPMFILDGIIWLFVLVLAVIGFVACGSRRAATSLLIMAGFLIVSVTVTAGNYGTMERLRVQPLVVLLPLVAIGIQAVMNHRRSRCENSRTSKPA
ncbi:glycosyltransferase family 39 protein [Lysinibacter cavernae]|uniref:Glycosyltransferase RgtA/B/C/D-like domain-containing protein n=1 Tax=Lysinibacter cavernae TaxID=1640652 RepID=A0A7X5R265_9MICO|nr:glycosyltransferase family 39 protein [Lysinibacter cavernae]NIH54117.1 hypothetical protein [Lysinibacter cavernae]